MTTPFAIPAKHWLWTSMLTPMARSVVVDQLIRPVRYEHVDGVHCGIYEAAFPEGTVLLTTSAGVPERFGTAYVVLGDLFQHIWDHEAQDILDPAEATPRLHERLRTQARLDLVSRRVRFPDGHSMQRGEFRVWGGWYAVVTDTTPRQVWVRAATDAEILAHGGVLPVAPVGAELLAAIRAEAAEDAAAAPAAA